MMRAEKTNVVYLCPTKQLANQVHEQAKSFGLNTSVFVGPKSSYNKSEFSLYSTAQSIAVTTYNGLFNVKPKIDSPGVIILDDAHSAETPIANMWSISISNKGDYEELFSHIIDLFEAFLPESFFLSTNDYTGDDIELIPGPIFRQKKGGIIRLLDQFYNNHPREPHYQFTFLKKNLHACNLFCTPHSLLIRPIIPPSFAHRPFNDAKQRIYMSATLGAPGELERIIGVQKIVRIPSPEEFKEQSNGRRFFLIPELSFDDSQTDQFIVDLNKRCGRALYIAPTNKLCEELSVELSNKGITVFTAHNIENSLDPFTENPNVSALVLSRYDGIDLPDDQCRLMIIKGKPSAVNLQEKFLLKRVAATPILQTRIMNRFNQGIGRCTRSDTDYAIVILQGSELVDYISDINNSRLLHPEIQAELQFGLSQSRGISDPDQLFGPVESFLTQNHDWEDVAEPIIKQESSESDCVLDQFYEQIEKSAIHEVAYLKAVWDQQWDKAAIEADKSYRSFIDGSFRGYRGFWQYLVGDAKEAQGQHDNAQHIFAKAAHECPSLRWLSRLKQTEQGPTHQNSTSFPWDDLCGRSIEQVLDEMNKHGVSGTKILKMIDTNHKRINSTQHSDFHQGLEFLGKFLGYQTCRPDGDGAPDCIWFILPYLYFAIEAKSEHDPSRAIGINDVRQAESHENWIRAKLNPSSNAIIVPVITSPRTTFDDEAKIHAKKLTYMHVKTFQALFDKVTQVITNLRHDIRSKNDIDKISIIKDKYSQEKLLPTDIHALLNKEIVCNIKK